MAIGSALADKLIVMHGKRNVVNLVYALNLVAICANCLKLILSFPAVIIGRFIFGLATGALNTVLGKILNDSIPNEVSQYYGLSTNSGLNAGILAISAIGAVLVPLSSEGHEALQENTSWRILPLIIISTEVFIIIVVAVFFPHASIKDGLKLDDHTEVDKLIRKIYKFESEEAFAQVKQSLMP